MLVSAGFRLEFSEILLKVSKLAQILFLFLCFLSQDYDEQNSEVKLIEFNLFCFQLAIGFSLQTKKGKKHSSSNTFVCVCAYVRVWVIFPDLLWFPFASNKLKVGTKKQCVYRLFQIDEKNRLKQKMSRI